MNTNDATPQQWSERSNADAAEGGDNEAVLLANQELQLEVAERRRQEKIQKATYQISEAVHTENDLPSFYAKVHSIVESLMPARNFYIALLDRRSQSISFPYFVDEKAITPPDPRPIGMGLTGVVLRTGKTLLADRALNERSKRVGDAVLLDGFDAPYVEAGRRAAVWLGAPLMSAGKTFGVMALQDYADETAYGECEKQLLTFVAEQTALAIERKRTEQDLRRRTEQVQKHRDVLLELAQADKSDLLRALGKICSRAAATMDVARVSYWSLADNGNAIVCELLHGDTGKARGARLSVGDAPEYFAALGAKRPIVADDVGTHASTRDLLNTYLTPLGISSMLDAPVWVRGQVVGVLCHEHVGAPRHWTAEEIDFASALAAMVSLALEESQRARSEHLLRESEERFRALFEATSQGVMLHDEKAFFSVNPAAVRILGYQSADQLIGKHPAEISVPYQPNGEESRVAAQRQIDKCIREGTARFDWLMQRPDGSFLTIDVLLTVIDISGRKIIQAVVEDITERKRAEAELLRTLAREKELGQLRSNFVSMVSHEFRTPLGIIQSSAEILEDYVDRLEPAERTDHLRSITNNTRRMAGLMEEVLLIGSFDAGKMQFKATEVDLRAFAGELIDEVLSATGGRCPVEFSTDDVPQVGNADKRLLRHIFTNLLTNAVKYSEPGRAVQLRLARAGSELVATFCDHGIGIPEADREWLFCAFHRGRNVGDRPGTGLGLVIVKRCVDLHGGRIEVESEIGKGSSFIVRLPNVL
jgi:PAS domain S-box-containing protein